MNICRVLETQRMTFSSMATQLLTRLFRYEVDFQVRNVHHKQAEVPAFHVKIYRKNDYRLEKAVLILLSPSLIFFFFFSTENILRLI